MNFHGIVTGSLALILLTAASGTDANAEDQTKRDAVIAALVKNDVSVLSLGAKPEQGGPSIALGTGPTGDTNNSASDENLALIAQLPELERVAVYYGRFSADGLAKLAALPKLKSISFLAPAVEPAVFAGLAKSNSLEDVRFVQYNVTDDLLGYLKEATRLNSFEATQMTGEKLSVDAISKFLTAHNDLRQFLLIGNAIDDDCVKQLGRMKNLERLMLTSRKVTPSGWLELIGLKKMRFLDLRGTNFDDVSAPALEGMQELHYLILSQTRLTDVGMVSLAGLKKLGDLSLDESRVTDVGMVHLKELTALENSDFSRTAVTAKGLAFVPKKEKMLMMRVGNGGLSAQQFGEYRALFPMTQMFDPSGYWTEQRAAQALEELSKERPLLPTEKDEPKQPKPADKDEAQTAAIKALQANGVGTNGINLSADLGGPYISLGSPVADSRATTANDENLGLVAQLTQLERVVLYRGNFTKAGLSLLNGMSKLRTLTILDPELNPEVIAAFAELRIPYSLTIEKKEITDELLGQLANNPKFLKGLFIVSAPKLTPAAMAKFLDRVDDLEDLSIGYVKDVIDDEGMKHLAKMKSLKRLWIESQNVTPEGWKALAGLTKMEFLDVRGTSFDDAAMATLVGMKDLHVLMLTKTRVTDAGMKSIAGLTKLSDVSFVGTKITDAGMENLNGMTELANLYVSETDVTAKGLAYVPKKDKMVMMSAGKAALAPKQLDELMTLYPGTQIFDPSGYWRPERIEAAMKELGKEVPVPKK